MDMEVTYPCTSKQLWMLSILEARPEAGVGQYVWELSQAVDFDRFQAAWNGVVETSHILRTRIVYNDAGPFQVVIKNSQPQLLAHGKLKPYLDHAMAEAILVPGSSLVQAAIIRPETKSDLPKFALTIHHAIFDYSSVTMVLAFVQAFYEGKRFVVSPPFSTFSASSSVFPDPAVSRKYWQHQLDGLSADAFPAIPTGRKEQAMCRDNYEHIMDVQFQPNSNFSLPVFIQLAWGMVVHHYTDSEDVLYGITMSSHDSIAMGHPKYPTSVIVPLRMQLGPHHHIKDALVDIATHYPARLAHGHLGLLEISKINEEAFRACRFMSHLVINPSMDHFLGNDLFGTRLQQRNPILSTCALDICCTPMVENQRLIVTFDFDMAVLGKEEVKRLSAQFEHVLHQICSNADRKKISDIDVLSPLDVCDLEKWNSTLPQANSRCLHEMVLDQCHRHAKVVAVSSWDGDLSYHDLDNVSGVIAHQLVECGVRNGTLVVLCLERSKWMSVAMLAVLRAGGVCVPVDLTQPKSRIEAVLADTKASIVVASSGTHQQFQGINFVSLSQDLVDEIQARPTQRKHNLPTVDPMDTAFVFYTSGSTGRPKGVIMAHQNIATGLRDLNLKMNVRPGIRVLHFASYAFDASMHEILNAFITGGCLCIPSESERTDLGAFIQRQRVTWAVLTPSAASALSPDHLLALETLVLTGEKMAESDVDKWGDHVTLFNAFGPTESAFCCTVERIQPTLWKPGNVGPVVNGIGWITRPHDPMQLSAIGAIGELLVEGPALARGYLGDIEKTASAFISTPPWLQHFRGSGGDQSLNRLYRTGDLVRYNGDGSLQFLGRRDGQIKIRGQRVELGEVEHHVRQVLGGTTTVVAELVRPSGGSNPMLLVFIVWAGEDEAFHQTVLGLEKELGNRLPAHMIPRAFIPIDCIPTTATGKTDRRRLQQVGESLTLEQLVEPYREASGRPMTEMEQLLQSLWAPVLEIYPEKIHSDDSFLRIGGDSITAMRLVSKAREFGLSLTMADVFYTPRLYELARVVAARDLCLGNLPQDTIAPLSMLGSQVNYNDVLSKVATICGLALTDLEDVYPCTPLQEGMLARTMNRPGDNVSPSILELNDSVDIGRFQSAWGQTARAAPILRTRIVDLPGRGLMQVIVNQEPQWAFGRDLAVFLANGEWKFISLGTPLTRFAIVEDQGKRFFVWVKHHAMYDGWSIPLILKNVENNYHGHCGQSTSFTPFQVFVQHTIQSADSAHRYWRHQLEAEGSNAVAFPALPNAEYRPRADSVIQQHISNISWPSHDITPSTAVRAAWAILVSHYTHSDTIFGVTVTGREAPVTGIESVVGPTIATVPVHIHIDEEISVLSLLQRVQRQAVEMIPFQHIGLQQIQKISPEASQFHTLLVVQPASSMETSQYKGDLYRGKEGNHGDEDMTWVNSFNPCALMVECQLNSDDSATLRFSFDSKVIEESQLRRIARQLEYILQQIGESCSKHVGIRTLNVTTPDDLNDIWAWNATVPDTVRVPLHVLIAKQARLHPGNLAVCAWDGQLTYEELDMLSTQLAFSLVRHGAGRGTVIPLYFPKSLWMPVAKLGVMKTGGASAALDITQPVERSRSIMDQIRPSIILSSNELAESAEELASSAVIGVGPWLWKSRYSDRGSSLPQLPKVDGSDTLYISFTSGSTGAPKGVIISHQNVTSSIHHQQWILALDTSSRIYNFASYAFDVAWLDFFYALSAGACLCVPSEASRIDDISTSMRQFKVTWACLTPSTARLIKPAGVPTLRTLILAGEPMHEQDIIKWSSKVELKNFYGPSESITSTGLNVDEQLNMSGSIGRGLGLNTWVVSLAGDRLVSIGAVGELWLEGPLVGKGYLNDLEKTKNSFIEDPTWLLQGGPGRVYPGRRGRVYRTGDMVQYKSDGTLVYVGRKDDQVKIRGQRVQLEEVEHHIRQILDSGGNMQVVADIIRPRGNNPEPILVLFYSIDKSADDAQSDARAALRRLAHAVTNRLASRLPTYMIPSMYIPVDQIPFTITGKTNRRGLREIGERLTLEQLAELQPIRGEHQEPQTPTEYRLRELWSSILGVAAHSIGRDDNFLRIGGDSIAAIRFVATARDQGLRMSVADVFTHPSLCELADVATIEERPDENVYPFSLLPPGIDKRRACSQAAVQCNVDATQIEDLFPCTPLQEGLLAITTKRPNEYIDQSVFQLPENINVVQFRKAWEEVVRIVAPVLRIRIVDLQDLGLVQAVVAEDIQWTMSQNLNAYLRQDKETSMGLGTSLTRFALVEDAESSKQFFIWTKHHSIYDGWSIPLVEHWVESIYWGQNSNDSTDSTSFQKFVKYITESSKDANRYWRRQLTDSEAVHFPSLPSRTYEPKADRTVHYHISGLKWPLDHGITASTVLRSGWAILMAHYTYSYDVIFGATVLGRNVPVPGIELIPGPTIATVPVRICIPWDMNLLDFVHLVQIQGIEMIPFEQTGLRHISKISQALEYACQFQTLLVVQSASSSSDQCELFQGRLNYDSDNTTGLHAFNPYALMVVCEIETNGVKLKISFDSEIIEHKQVCRMVKQLKQVLLQICTESQMQVQDLDLVSKEDMQDIWTWNIKVPPAVPACVHNIISERVNMQPQAPAICAWDGDLTYQDLDEMSGRLASYLVGHGVSRNRETIIPLCFEKSVWMPVAMLAVMKAGAASVAIDVNQPKERLRSIIQQVNPTVIMCSAANQRLAAQLSIRNPPVVVVVGHTQLQKLSIPDQRTSLPSVNPSSALYVVFTSGSTGKPKGVIITHSNFSSAIKYQKEILRFGPNSRVFDFASYAFDASWSNFLHAVSSGGCLCIPSESEKKDQIAASIVRMNVTYADLTPSTARLLDPSTAHTLRTLILAGEPMAKQDIDTWASKLTLMNTYGPAECSVTATASDALHQDNKDMNIGHGAGLTTWIVEPFGLKNLAPIGSIGELWLEGPLVAQGYLGDTRKTNENFVEDPAWLLHGGPGYPGRRGRLYRTGDLVKYNTDGALVFIGRKDNQVKINGQRLELGEVEHHVRQSFPGVYDVLADVVVPKSEKQPSSAILAAFVCGNLESYNGSSYDIPNNSDDNDNNCEILLPPNETFASAALATEARLTDLLPRYMVPAVFLPLRRIPIATTGKANRNWLRKLVSFIPRQQLFSYVHGSKTKRKPSTAVEYALQEVWARVLNLEPAEIGMDDSFFRLGGDSISAMQLSSKCRVAGLAVTVSQIFQYKSVALLAQCAQRIETILVIDQEEPLETPFALSPIQQMFFDVQKSAKNDFCQSFLVRVSREITSTDMTHALEMIVKQHSMLRARFRQAPDGTWFQMVTSNANTASCRYNEHVFTSWHQAIPFMNATKKSLNIESGPLFAVDSISIKDSGQYLVLVAHHLIIDLVSWRIILEDLEELLVSGTTSHSRSLSFQTWCRLQADYSRTHLVPEASLPFQVSMPNVDYWGLAAQRQNSYGDTHIFGFTIPKHATDLLLGPANNAFGTSPVEIFQSALLNSFVQTFRNRPAPTIYNEGHGREPWDEGIDISRTVGWFTTIWPTGGFVDCPQDITDAVRQTKDCRRQIPKNGWAYFTSRYLNPEGKQAFPVQAPVEIMFNYEGLYQQLERPDSLFRIEGSGGDDDELTEMRDIKRSSLIEVTATIRQGRLQFQYLVNRYMEHQDLILYWISSCKQCLEEMAAQLPHLTPTSTLCDFPRLPLTYQTLEELLYQSLPQFDIAPKDIEDAYPCTPTQQLMLRAQMKQPKFYVTSFVGEIRAREASKPIDLEKLMDSWRELVVRHPSLRTIFLPSVVQGGWDQVVLKHANDANIINLRCASDEILQTLRAQPQMDCQGQGLPHRIMFCPTTTAEAVFFRLDTNHAIMDAVSLSVLFHQWAQVYSDRNYDHITPVYSNYVGSLLRTAEMATEYWINRLQSFSPCLIPVTSMSENELGNLQKVQISFHEVADLRTLCQDHGFTVPTLLKSAWAILLSCYTGQRSVCFGYFDSGRHMQVAGVKEIVGALINLLICQVHLDDPSRLGSILATVQDDYHRSLSHQYGALPALDKLQLTPPSQRSFNTLMNYRREHNEERMGTEKVDVSIGFISGEDGMEFDVALNIDDDGNDLSISIDYWDARISDTVALQISSLFQTILAQVICDLNQQVWSVKCACDRRRQV